MGSMYEHLQYFLEKTALAIPGAPDLPQSGGPAVVPSFPPASGTNMGVATAPPLSSVNRFEPAIQGGTTKSIGGGTSSKAPSAPSGGSTGKTGAVRSVGDFTNKVRGPLQDMRKEQYTSPFDDPIEWGAPTSVEGGDAGSRLAPAGSTHPDVKIAAGVSQALTVGARAAGMGAKGTRAASKGGLIRKTVDGVRSFFGSKPRKATGMDVLSTGATPLMVPGMTATQDAAQVGTRMRQNLPR